MRRWRWPYRDRASLRPNQGDVSPRLTLCSFTAVNPMNDKHETLSFDSKHPERHVDDLVHELLTPEQAAIVQAWCDNSDEGQAALAAAQERMSVLSSVGAIKPSPALVSDTIRRIEGKVERRKGIWKLYRRGLLMGTAASILLIAGIQWYYSKLAPTPYDLRVIGQNELIAGSNGSMQVFVRDVQSRGIVDGIPLELHLRDRSSNREVHLASYQSGSNIPQFDIPDWDAGEYELVVKANVDGSAESIVKTITLRRPWSLLLTSDKPMYQPGQMIHLRCQGLRRPLLKPVEDEAVTFLISDPKGNVIFKEETTTSRFGIASADCQLANEILMGDYVAECRVGSTSSYRTLKVDRYVLPKIQARLEFDRSFYAPGDQVKVDVDAQYVFGKPIADGRVKLFFTADGLNLDLGKPLEGELDEAGHAEFEFELPAVLAGRPQEGGQARIRAIAEVTDAAKQSLVVAGSRVVTQRPILVEIVPESPFLLQGEENRVYVMTQYADGRPAPTELLVNSAQESIETNQLGIAELTLTPNESEVGLTITARDQDGLTGRGTARLAASNASQAFLARTDRSVYNSGDTIQFSAIGGGVEPILIDLIKDDQTVASYVVQMEEGNGALDIDVPLDVFGTVRLEAYRFNTSGFARRQTRVLMIRQADQLVVKTSFDKSEYKPGEMAMLEFRLSDADGKPRPGALGVSVVDEALFSLLNSKGSLEQTFFMLEQELLKPVYAIYNDWNPFDEPELEPEDQRLLERALFARTTYAASGRQALRFEGERSPRDSSSETGGNTFRSPTSGQVTEVRYDNPYSMAVGNYRHKVRRVDQQRREGLSACRTAWAFLASAVMVALVAGFAFAFPKIFAILVCIGGTVTLLCGGFLSLAYMWVGDEMRVDAGMASEETASNDMFAGGVDGEAPMEALAEGARSRQQQPPRVREQFPETLFWAPELITDDNGVARMELPLADSITTWRMSLNAVDANGRLGSAQEELLVFQPFQVDIDMPVKLTRGDEVEMPIVVYNYTDETQTVKIDVEQGDWFERLESAGEQAMELTVEPGQVSTTHYRMVARKVGQHDFTVVAIGDSSQDAIRRVIEVAPDGTRFEESLSGRLTEPFTWEGEVPVDAIEGSVRANVRFYPTMFSQLVEGLDTIFKRPYGCFEQTSSTTYPNVMALQYLRENDLSVPQVEAKARQYIHIGYQRLVSFEVRGGGFDWYGQAPASVPLTAYGLLEFKDMAKVHNVDPKLIERTERYLLRQREQDGSWNPRNANGTGFIKMAETQDDARLLMTATAAWALFKDREENEGQALTRDYLLANAAGDIDDPYILAMMIHALAAIDRQMPEIGAYADRLEALHETEAEGQHVFWTRGGDVGNLLYSRGRSAEVEVTSLATLALIEIGRGARLAPGALQWLVVQKDPEGTWHTTQATVLALKALLAGSSATVGEGMSRVLIVTVDGMQSQRLEVPANQAEVVQQIDMSGQFGVAGPHRVEIQEESSTAIAFQFNLSYYRPIESEEPSDEEPLAIDLVYDRDRLQVDESVDVRVSVLNQSDETAPMVMLDLPVPAGFAVNRAGLDAAVKDGRIGKYQVSATQIIVYLRQLSPTEPLELNYSLRATMPVRIQVPPAQVYEYYDPDRNSKGGSIELQVHRA